MEGKKKWKEWMNKQTNKSQSRVLTSEIAFEIKSETTIAPVIFWLIWYEMYTRNVVMFIL